MTCLKRAMTEDIEGDCNVTMTQFQKCVLNSVSLPASFPSDSKATQWAVKDI